MLSDIKEGILLVILLIIGLILIIFDIITMPKHTKKEESKDIIVWDDAGLWINAREYHQHASKIGATGIIIKWGDKKDAKKEHRSQT